MNALIVIAMLALSFFGPGWSSEHKAYWEWQLGRPLEGWEEARLSRGINPDGNGRLIDDATLTIIAKYGDDPASAVYLACPGPGCEIVGEIDYPVPERP